MNWRSALNAISSFGRGFAEQEQKKKEEEERKKRWEVEYKLRKEQADRDAVRLDWERDERIRKQKMDTLNLSTKVMENAMLDKQLSYADADRQYQLSHRKLEDQKESLLIEDARNRSMHSRMQLDKQKSIDESGYDAYAYMFSRLNGKNINVPGVLAAESLAAGADAAQRYGLPLEWTQAQAEAITSAIKGSQPKAWKLSSYIDKDGTEISYALDESGMKIAGSEIDSNKLHPDVQKAYDSVVKEYTEGLNDYIGNYSKSKGLYSAAQGSMLNLNNLAQTGIDKVFGDVSSIYTAQVDQYEQRYGTFRDMYDRKMSNVLPDKEIRDQFFDMMAPSFARTKPIAQSIADVGKEVNEAVMMMQKDTENKLDDQEIRAVMQTEIDKIEDPLERHMAQGALNRSIPHEPEMPEDRTPSMGERITNPQKRWDTTPMEAVKDWWKQHEKKKEVWQSPVERIKEWRQQWRQ